MEQKLLEQKSSGGVIEGPPSSGRDVGDIPSTEKGRRFVFTYYPDGDEKYWFPEDMSYCYYGDETCPTTGKRHYQGWFITHNPRSERALCKKFSTWIRIMRGTYKHNWTYCGKDGKINEFGTKPNQGKRTDLDEIKTKILDRETTVDKITVENPLTYHQYGRTLEKLEDIALQKTWRKEMTKGLWIFGKTGTGKSEAAFDGYHPDKHYLWTDDKGWWDGYTQQEIVIIDEFRGQIPFNVLLRLCDKWPFSVPRRNRKPIPFTSKLIIITSSMKPEDVYHNLNERDSLDQLHRRFEIKRFGDIELPYCYNEHLELQKQLTV